MTRGEFWFSFGVVVVLMIAVLGLSNLSVAFEPRDYLTKVQEHLEVPEPIDLIFWDADFRSFDRKSFLPKRATIEYDKHTGHWVVVLNRDWWKEAPYYSRLSTLSHEICHAVYDHDVLMPDLWYALTDDELRMREARASQCAVTVLEKIK